ncbi:MAG: RNA 3'-phosphate cyclase [Thermoplasmatales archaeon]|nr:RNA 3'-phosphate cyclase [Thermoplasmatales archaeon]
MLEIDCSKGEGGGQMVRTSVAMAAITGTKTRLFKIRENRPTKGLSKQHCAAVKAVTKMTGATVQGNSPGSRELTITPGDGMDYDVHVDIRSAGSISLVLQAMILAGIKHDRTHTMTVSGGTNVLWAPPIDFYPQLLFPLMGRMGIDARMEILERGFFPEGGGKVRVTVEPVGRIKPLNLDTLGPLKSVGGVCFVKNLPDRVPEQIIAGAKEVLDPVHRSEIALERSSKGRSKGAGLSLVATYGNGMLGANSLSMHRDPPKNAGRDAGRDLLREMESGATLDVNTADQLLPYMAMADGVSSFTAPRISRHLLSQMDTLETFLDVRFGVERRDGIYHFTVTPGECG